MKTVAWTAYRQARQLAFSVIGRNPLRVHRSWREDYRSLRSLRGLAARNARRIRVVDGLEQWETPLGPLWLPAGARPDFASMLCAEILAGVYPVDGIRAGDTVLDCGANIGAFSVLALKRGARVIAFEPSPRNAQCLVRNAPQATVHRFGVWDSCGTLRFSTKNLRNPGGHHVSDDGDTEIAVTTIDALKPDRVDYIKIDVEGAELRALRGAALTIRRCRPAVCVATEHTSDLHRNATDVIALMREYGYRDYKVTDAHPVRSASAGYALTPYTVFFPRY